MTRIVINGDSANAPADTAGSWWLNISPEQFYATVHARQPMLALKFGSAPVSTLGPIQASLGERIRQRRRDAIERHERAVGSA